ncbi:hypothetical protein JYP51_12880 [Ponticoccus gilvus]|nr:hypothetical protein [Enemella evansiae]
MPRLIRLYIVQTLAGFALSAVFVGILLWFNVANLRDLIGGSDVGLLALFLLWLFNGIVFGGVQFGIAIMRMARSDSGGGGRRQPLSQPVRAESRARPRRRDLLRRL